MYLIAETSVFRFITSLLVAVTLVLTPVISTQASMGVKLVAAQEVRHSDGMPCHVETQANALAVSQYKGFDHNPCNQCCKDGACQSCLLCNACMTTTHFPVLLLNIPVLFVKTRFLYLSPHSDRYINIILSPDLQPPIV